MTEVRVFFSTQDGLTLEGLLHRGEAGGVILCHPHPLYGGTMFNNVVDAVQGSLVGKGFSTLRFNFRGVGGSKGEYGDGALEVEDIRGAAAFIAQEVDGPLYLAGYSFGAYVGLSGVASDDRVKALICISPPLAIYNFTALRDERRPKLIVAGERDFICPVTELEELFLSLSQPKGLHIVPGADHFWWGIEDRVADYVIDFLQGL